MTTLRPIPFAAALGLSLAVLSLLCWLAVLVTPTAPLAHNWLGLFTTAPVSSIQALVASIGVSLIAGAFTGFVTAFVYSALSNRRT